MIKALGQGIIQIIIYTTGLIHLAGNLPIVVFPLGEIKVTQFSLKAIYIFKLAAELGKYFLSVMAMVMDQRCKAPKTNLEVSQTPTNSTFVCAPKIDRWEMPILPAPIKATLATMVNTN